MLFISGSASPPAFSDLQLKKHPRAREQVARAWQASRLRSGYSSTLTIASAT